MRRVGRFTHPLLKASTVDPCFGRQLAYVLGRRRHPWLHASIVVVPCNGRLKYSVLGDAGIHLPLHPSQPPATDPKARLVGRFAHPFTMSPLLTTGIFFSTHPLQIRATDA